MSFLKYVIIIAPILLSSCVSLLTASSGEVTVSDYESISNNENVKISYGNFKNTSSDEDFTPLSDSVIHDIHKLWGLIYKIEDTNHFTQYVLSDRVPNPTRFYDYGLSASLVGLSVFTASKGTAGLFLGAALLVPSSIINVLYIRRYISEGNSKSTSINYVPRRVRKKKNDEIFLKAGKLSIVADQIRRIEYRTTEQYKNNNEIKSGLKSFNKNQLIENQSGLFESIILESGFSDKNDFLSNSENSVMINASIRRWDKHIPGYSGIVANEFIIDWEFIDVLSEELLMSLSDTIISDFMIDGRKFYISQIRNGLEKSLIKVLNKESVSSFLKKENNKSTSYKDPILIETSNYSESKGESLKSTVTVKGNKKQGSGFIISSDGYLLSNYHVVGNNDTTDIIMYDGTIKKAKVLRVSKKYDLALLKIDVLNHIHLKISTDTTILDNLIGREVYVVGTPIDSSLGQSISVGIISGMRAFSGINTLQTNASINRGNSGGPVVLDNNEVVAVVNAKLNGEFIEGVGFAIPIRSIYEALNIKISYK